MHPSSQTVKETPDYPQDESEELRRFREEWRREVVKRKEGGSAFHPPDPAGAVGNSTDYSASSESTSEPSSSTNHDLKTLAEPGSSGSSLPEAPTNVSPASFHVTTSPSLSQGLGAVAIYREAVLHEQRGELEEALYLYRAAFRREPNVDRLYEREEKLGSILEQQQFIIGPASASEVESLTPTPTPKTNVVLAGDGLTMEDLSKRVENTLAVQDSKKGNDLLKSDTLASVLDNFPQELVFEPENEEQSVPLNELPEEIVVSILKALDPTSIERFASVNRKARVLSLDVSIWRHLVNTTYQPPQIPIKEDENFLDYLSTKYLYDYRRLFIEHPRVRLDGVYIAVCHYIRPGLSENSWVNVNHLITYHRYLRFFPNGLVMSLLTNEERSPAQVIPLLKPTLRGLKGLFFGNWHLSGTTIILSNLIDASSKATAILDFASPSSVAALLKHSTATHTQNHGNTQGSGHAHGHHHGHADPKHTLLGGATHSSSHSSSTDPLPLIRYVFRMQLTLLSRPLGRWNKMDIVSYDSVSLETGDAAPVALKHERPFWFSKVRSFV